MKKFLTFTLVLIMALSLAAPALAYTAKEPAAQGTSPFTVDLGLVEHSGSGSNWISGWLSLPPADRGYATNEVVAAVGTVTIPKGGDLQFKDSYYKQLRFSSNNVTFRVADNNYVYVDGGDDDTVRLKHSFPNGVLADDIGTWNFDGNDMTNAIKDVSTPGKNTYSVLAFGKVTGDEATITFTLSRGATFETLALAALAARELVPNGGDPDDAKRMILSDELFLYKIEGTTEHWYYVFDQNVGYTAVNGDLPAADGSDLRLIVKTKASNGASLGTSMFIGEKEIGIHYDGAIFFVDEAAVDAADKTIRSGNVGYKRYMAEYEDLFVGVLGLDAAYEGNLLKEGDWKKIAASFWDVSETVDVEPYTIYVSVPDNIVVDPPKTGDASFLGFVLIALAGAAAVVVRKVRA